MHKLYIVNVTRCFFSIVKASYGQSFGKQNTEGWVRGNLCGKKTANESMSSSVYCDSSWAAAETVGALNCSAVETTVGKTVG